jgi:hypothetical protein
MISREPIQKIRRIPARLKKFVFHDLITATLFYFFPEPHGQGSLRPTVFFPLIVEL